MDPPDVFKNLTIAVANQILNAIDAGMPSNAEGRRYSGQHQARERAAWPVVQEHCPTLTEAMAKLVIKTWLQTQVLIPMTNLPTRKHGIRDRALPSTNVPEHVEIVMRRTDFACDAD